MVFPVGFTKRPMFFHGFSVPQRPNPRAIAGPMKLRSSARGPREKRFEPQVFLQSAEEGYVPLKVAGSSFCRFFPAGYLIFFSKKIGKKLKKFGI